MKFVTIRELKLKTKDVWSKLDKDGLVLLKNGKPFAFLTPIDEKIMDKEINAIARSKALIALDAIHRNSTTKGTYKLKMKDIEAEIRTARKLRHC